ncbi:MAG TPA: YibE/F family protein [Marmoricola sp.]
MAHTHAHTHGPAPDVPVRSTARLILLGALGVVAVLTVVGVVAFWPSHTPHPSGDTSYAAPGVTFPRATVTKVEKACPENYGGGEGATCGKIGVRVTQGAGKGQTADITVPPEVFTSGLSKGDTVELVRTPGKSGAAAELSYFTIHRSGSLWILFAVFLLVVVAVARLRGLLAVVGLGFGALVLVKFMLPALLTGESGTGVALTGSAAIMFVVLYLAHGPSLRTSAALAGTLGGVGVTAIVALLTIHHGHLTGVTDESGAILSTFAGNVSFQGLLTCAVIVAGLGVLNDVTITQASAVWELRAAGDDMGRRELFTSAMRIGRDHIASTIYTIVFAYAGTALMVLLLLYYYERPFLQLLSTEDIAEEITRTLASAIGLVLAVPITTAIAVACVAGPRQVRRSRGSHAG